MRRVEGLFWCLSLTDDPQFTHHRQVSGVAGDVPANGLGGGTIVDQRADASGVGLPEEDLLVSADFPRVEAVRVGRRLPDADQRFDVGTKGNQRRATLTSSDRFRVRDDLQLLFVFVVFTTIERSFLHLKANRLEGEEDE